MAVSVTRARISRRDPLAGIERVEWSDFLLRFEWVQGEHIAVIGHTGSGKTTLAKAILPKRRYIVVFACKPQDAIITEFRREGFTVGRNWPPHPGVEKYVFWPRIESLSDVDGQRTAIHEALHSIYRSGGWTVYLDECAYVADNLNLAKTIKFLCEQARSLRISLVMSTQRPKFIPLVVYSSATHLFLFREPDENNRKRLGEISGVNSARAREIVAALPRYDVLYVNSRDDQFLITRVENGG